MASTVFNNVIKAIIDICSDKKTITGSSLSNSDIFTYVRIGKIIVFKVQINHSTSFDRTFSGMPTVDGNICCVARNTTTGSMGNVWMGGATVSTYLGGITWSSGQLLMFGGAYLTTS